MTGPLHWPACTEPECDHVRTWTTEADAREAATDPRFGYWVDPADGRAACACHRIARTTARFPCDVWWAANQ